MSEWNHLKSLFLFTVGEIPKLEGEIKTFGDSQNPQEEERGHVMPK